MPRRRLSLRHFMPLIGFVVPTLLIGYGFVIPNSCVAGFNELTLGLAITLASACVSYRLGLRALARDAEPPR